MNTEKGQTMAKERHKFMIYFLDQFLNELDEARDYFKRE